MNYPKYFEPCLCKVNPPPTIEGSALLQVGCSLSYALTMHTEAMTSLGGEMWVAWLAETKGSVVASFQSRACFLSYPHLANTSAQMLLDLIRAPILQPCLFLGSIETFPSLFVTVVIQLVMLIQLSLFLRYYSMSQNAKVKKDKNKYFNELFIVENLSLEYLLMTCM